MKGVLVPVEGDIRVVEHNGKWDGIAKAIGSQYIERVNLGLPGGLIVMVDEEGILHRKPVNPRLSLFYPGIEHGAFLHGDALIVREGWVNDSDGYGVDVVDMDDAEATAITIGNRLNAELANAGAEYAAGIARVNSVMETS